MLGLATSGQESPPPLSPHGHSAITAYLMRIKCADLQSAMLANWAGLFRRCCALLLRRTAVRVGCRTWRSFAQRAKAQQSCRGPSLTASCWGWLVVVLGDGEHHNDNATDAIRNFLGDRDRIHSLRLHSHAETNEEAPKRNFAGSSAGST